MTPSLGGFLTPMSPGMPGFVDEVKEVPASVVPTTRHQLLNKVSGRRLELDYRFTRTQHLASSALVNIELTFFNKTKDAMTNIYIAKKVSPIRKRGK